MTRLAIAPALALLIGALGASTVHAQATPATPTTGSPAAPAKWVPPVKGTATIAVVKTPSKKAKGEILTTLKVKNTSTGSINLLSVEELWYDQKRALVSSGSEKYRKPLLPGEIVELTIKSPDRGQPVISTMTFTHANGKVDAKTVKAFQ
jgi:hypothetical protein